MHQQGFVHHRVQGFPAWKTKVQMTSWTLNTSYRNVKYYIFRGQSEGLKILGDEDEQQRKEHLFDLEIYNKGLSFFTCFEFANVAV